MIKSIKIKNFQNHKDSVLEFHPNVNIIQGNSNNGKSAIFRACDVVFNNNPNKYERYKPWDSEKKDTTKIELSFEDGKIVRKRNSVINSYQLNGGEELSSFGHNPPADILKFLSFGDYNFRDQANKYFFITETSSERARMLNQITGLSIIDQTQVELDTNINRIKAKITQSQEEIESLETSLLKFKNLETIESLVVSIENFSQKVAGLEQKTLLLKNLIKKINSNIKIINEYKNFLQCLLIKELIFQLMSDFSDKIKKTSKLKKVYINILENENSKKSSLRKLSKEDAVSNCIQLIENHKHISDKIEKAKSLNSKITKYDNFIVSVANWLQVSLLHDDIVSYICRYKNTLAMHNKMKDFYMKSNDQYSLTKKLKSNTLLLVNQRKEIVSNIDICPLCGRTG